MWMHRKEKGEWAGRAEPTAEQGPGGGQMWDKKMASSAGSQRVPEKLRVPSECREVSEVGPLALVESCFFLLLSIQGTQMRLYTGSPVLASWV